eukprot:g4690.t1
MDGSSASQSQLRMDSVDENMIAENEASDGVIDDLNEPSPTRRGRARSLPIENEIMQKHVTPDNVISLYKTVDACDDETERGRLQKKIEELDVLGKRKVALEAGEKADHEIAKRCELEGHIVKLNDNIERLGMHEQNETTRNLKRKIPLKQMTAQDKLTDNQVQGTKIQHAIAKDNFRKLLNEQKETYQDVVGVHDREHNEQNRALLQLKKSTEVANLQMQGETTMDTYVEIKQEQEVDAILADGRNAYEEFRRREQQTEFKADKQKLIEKDMPNKNEVVAEIVKEKMHVIGRREEGLQNFSRESMDNDIGTKATDLNAMNHIANTSDKTQGMTIFEQKRSQRKRLRLQKWRRMMSQWEHFEQKYPGKIRQRIRKGIPNILRGHMWMSLTGAGVAKYHNANVYNECLFAPNSGLEETISRDISRTFPKHQQFRVTGGLGQRSLFQVLRAYSVYNPAVGYCQGMGYICALLLCYLNEEDAFWTMVSVMQKHQMEGLYREGLPKLQLYHIVLEKLMRLYLPNIASHLFDNLSMLPSMFASKWLLTIFTYSFPLDVVVRVWDIFMSEGWTIVFKVSLALVNLLRDDIIRETNFENVLRMLEEYPLSVPGRTIISAALQIPLSTIDLQRIERETIEETT